MAEPLIFAIPSKGRLKDQVEAWLADCGLPLTASGGARGYQGAIDGFDDVQVRLLSAADIAAALHAGEAHLGVTGEDLLRELGDDMEARIRLLRALGFGRADLVVAAPKSWIDVESMADVDDVAHLYLARTGRRLRVATKYMTQTRAFFARHGVADYRIVESSGATEGAPAAGAAELVVDITGQQPQDRRRRRYPEQPGAAGREPGRSLGRSTDGCLPASAGYRRGAGAGPDDRQPRLARRTGCSRS